MGNIIEGDFTDLEEYDDFSPEKEEKERISPDEIEKLASEELHTFFEKNRQRVYFSKQLEVQNERKYFHWITNRVLRKFVNIGFLHSETHTLSWGGSINVLCHKSYRYYKRATADLLDLVNAYSDPNIGGVVGLHGEFMVLEGFARSEFMMRGRNTHSYRDKVWSETGHNLDFIFEKDDIGYGVEVKNTLK